MFRSRARLGLALPALAFVLLASCKQEKPTPEVAVAEIRAVVATCAVAVGVVEVLRPGQAFWERVQTGTTFRNGDWIRTYATAFARVEFVSGEPDMHTRAELAALGRRNLSGVRLSCQILCHHDMTVRAISRLTGSGRPDAGPRPNPYIEPPPEY